MRVLVDVESGADSWSVTITPADGSRAAERAMARLPEAPFVGPADGALDPAQPHASLVGAQGAAARRDLVLRIARRQVSDRDLVLYGRYLFDSLIGAEAWGRLCGTCPGPGTLEIALRWRAEDDHLHAPLWEAMHDGRHFLSSYGSHAIAITRIIADATAEATPITTPPRILFAIGAELTDPAVRPGAEFVGVLRAVQNSGNPLTPFVLQQASLRTLPQAVRKFRPDAVHLICHGRQVQGEPRLILRPDDPSASVTEVPAGPEAVHAGLAPPGGRPPQVAVLSACESGAGRISERAGSETATPFAVGLVKAGIPIVVAMSGRVTDTACRLFSRRFGEALSNGDALVDAVAHGRRAAYLETDTPTTIDWLLPAVFLSAEIRPGFAPVQADAGRILRGRIDAYDLAWTPVFCGRLAFFDAYERLVDANDRLSALFAFWREPSGVGKDRLLRELAARALSDGHIPVIVMQAAGWPRSPVQVGAEFGVAIDRARECLGLEAAPSSFVTLVSEITGSPATVPTSRMATKAALAEVKRRDLDPSGGIAIHGGIADAIKEDLQRLVSDARAAGIVAAGATPFVVLGDVDEWDKGRAMLLGELLGTSGLRIGGMKVPVVATWKSGGAAGESLAEERRESQGQTWKEFLELAPLKDDEELLAYQWVLMHPRQGENGSPAGNVWVVVQLEGEWRARYRQHIQGLPRKFRSEVFELLAELMTEKREFAAGDDERVLHEYMARQIDV